MQKALGARMAYMALNVCGKLDTKRRHLPEWSGRDCLLGDVNTKMNNSGNQVVYQICPLQIQIGDILVISSEPPLQYPEIMNISEASFIDCLQNTTTEDQLWLV